MSCEGHDSAIIRLTIGFPFVLIIQCRKETVSNRSLLPYVFGIWVGWIPSWLATFSPVANLIVPGARFFHFLRQHPPAQFNQNSARQLGLRNRAIDATSSIRLPAAGKLTGHCYYRYRPSVLCGNCLSTSFTLPDSIQCENGNQSVGVTCLPVPSMMTAPSGGLNPFHVGNLSAGDQQITIFENPDRQPDHGIIDKYMLGCSGICSIP